MRYTINEFVINCAAEKFIEVNQLKIRPDASSFHCWKAQFKAVSQRRYESRCKEMDACVNSSQNVSKT